MSNRKSKSKFSSQMVIGNNHSNYMENWNNTFSPLLDQNLDHHFDQDQYPNHEINTIDDNFLHQLEHNLYDQDDIYHENTYDKDVKNEAATTSNATTPYHDINTHDHNNHNSQHNNNNNNTNNNTTTTTNNIIINNNNTNNNEK